MRILPLPPTDRHVLKSKFWLIYPISDSYHGHLAIIRQRTEA